jgi:RNA polymerase sigma-70 factor (ECF subfamily)
VPIIHLTTTDEVLFAAIARGDVNAFAVFYERHARLAVSLAARILGDDHLAEEATQDAFLSLWRGRASYDSTRGSPKTWLVGIVRHRATDCWRGESRRPARAQDSELRLAALVALDDVEAQIIAREQGRELVARVAELPVGQRDVIVLGYYRGLTQTEITRQLRLPVGTTKSRFRLALERLRVTADAGRTANAS